MRAKRRILSLFLCLVMMLTLVPATSVFAAEESELNPRWDGTTARWDAYPGFSGYSYGCILYKNGVKVSSAITSRTYAGWSSDMFEFGDGDYTFTVNAYAGVEATSEVYEYHRPDGVLIDKVIVTDVPKPVYGETCPSSIGVSSDPASRISNTSAVWMKKTGSNDDLEKYLSNYKKTDTFEEGTYRLFVRFNVNSGYVFDYADVSYGSSLKAENAVEINYTDSVTENIDAYKFWSSGRSYLLAGSQEFTVEAVTKYDVWVRGVQVTSSNKDNVLKNGTVSYDPDTNTLTVDGAIIDTPNNTDGIKTENGDLNVIVGKGGLHIETRRFGIDVAGDLTITGEGDIFIDANNSTQSAIRSKNKDILISNSGELKIENPKAGAIIATNGKVTLSGEGNVTVSAGVVCVEGLNEVEISGSGDVTVTSDQNGIKSEEGNVTISGDGNVSVTAKEGDGIYGYNSVEISGSGDVTITADQDGIQTEIGNITITDDRNVSVKTEYNYGIYTNKGNVTISSTGDVIVDAVDTGIFVYTGNLSVTNGLVEVTSEKREAVNANGGITIADTHEITTPEDGVAKDRYIYEADGTTAAKYVVIEPKCTHSKTEVKDAKEATCSEEGYTGDTYCVDCGELIETGEVIEKTAHTYGEWETTKEPTTMETGIKERVCACGEKESEEIPKLTVLTPVTSLELDVKGYEVGSDPSKTELICNTEGVVIQSCGWKYYESSVWKDFTGTFELMNPSLYYVEIFLTAEEGYDISGLTKEDVTIGGVSPYYFNNPYGDPNNGVIRIFKAMPMLTMDYSIISGDDSVWTKGSKESLIFVSDAPFDLFHDICIDNMYYPEEGFTAESGSTKITLSAELLEYYEVGSHTLTIRSTDGEASATFTILAADENAEPGDTSDDKKPEEPTVPPVPSAPVDPSDSTTPDDTDKPADTTNPTDPLVPSKPAEPTNPSDDNGTTTPDDTNMPAEPSNPKTGDVTSLFLLMTLLLTSGGAFASVAVFDKKRSE